jgi:hypothetical protein
MPSTALLPMVATRGRYLSPWSAPHATHSPPRPAHPAAGLPGRVVACCALGAMLRGSVGASWCAARCCARSPRQAADLFMDFLVGQLAAQP